MEVEVSDGADDDPFVGNSEPVWDAGAGRDLVFLSALEVEVCFEPLDFFAAWEFFVCQLIEVGEGDDGDALDASCVFLDFLSFGSSVWFGSVEAVAI